MLYIYQTLEQEALEITEFNREQVSLRQVLFSQATRVDALRAPSNVVHDPFLTLGLVPVTMREDRRPCTCIS